MILGKKALGTVAYLGGLPAVLERFCWSWGQMVAYNAEWMEADRYIHYEKASFSDHAPARNALVTRFLGDWLVQLDTDHQFEPDLVRRLVWTADRYGLDVLSGMYQMKNRPHVPVLYQWVGPEDSQGLQPLAFWPDDLRVVEIGSAGAGCLFVRRAVFDRIASELDEQAFEKKHPFSEDHSFFLRCKTLGIKAYAALNIQCQHLQVRPVTLGDLPGDGELQQSEPFAVEGYR